MDTKALFYSHSGASCRATVREVHLDVLISLIQAYSLAGVFPAANAA
jgi:hypothetical protein